MSRFWLVLILCLGLLAPSFHHHHVDEEVSHSPCGLCQMVGRLATSTSLSLNIEAKIVFERVAFQTFDAQTVYLITSATLRGPPSQLLS